MKKKFSLLIVIILLTGVTNSFAIKEITTHYNLTIYGFVTSTEGMSLKVKQLDNKEIELNKQEIKKITDVESEITFKNGTKFVTNITNIQGDQLEFTTDFGTKKLPMDDVIKINHLGTGNDSSPLISNSYNNYNMLGISILTPGVLNFILGRQFEDFGARLTGGLLFFTGALGFQGNFLFNLSKEENFEHNFSIGAGLISLPPTIEPSTYIGGFYDLNIYGFFFEGGLVLSDNYGAELMIQLGYVYRFNK